jgi:ABC-2 type transport system permease protein
VSAGAPARGDSRGSVAARSRTLAAIYRAKFRAEIALQFAYRGALAIWLLGLVLGPIIYLVVWTTVAESQGGQVGSYGAADFAAYFTLLMVVNQLTFTWHFHEFEWRIRNGFFSPLLLRPVHPIHTDIAENLTFKLLTFTLVVPVAIFLVVSFGARVDPEPWQALAFVPALVLAMALRFLIEWSFGMLAFWVTRMAALTQAYWVLALFLSGQVAPLELFPEPVRVAAAVLPFQWMVAFPVELGLGRVSPADAVVGFAAQLAWIGIALVVMRVGWRVAVRRYAAVGA